ncbi:uncharacterized protein LOC131246537 isoform X2 [Magnolia sinica]|nr:uncharacterized protein LOC131246537 isoform X2 [Magnolia sinica]XP_058102745.1 uncharacterized protein LOC131246537 isoform X2 [Magnolia sinica]XP_058102746.1 uncharacterized protein LOC131246537 isoform X2 [Magnolia sinica]XP_058102747.1 uncharacterized protein LOC131246537 isoform X2 [Magnolia sinica]XP_058102748.1 uncharacterized protein LOC131246537 isoform X2 [Magnolia sinica]XP_058102749.1 uncharacterized protein LOC131246537 isoform X2 [Magnolia sinica]
MGKTIAVCHVGGEFVTNNNGSMSYTGGEAYAIPVVPNMKFDEFKSEIAEMCNRDASTLFVKYFLPGNRRTPITVSNDKHMQCMADFHEDSATIDVFVLDRETIAQNTDKTDNNRANRATGRTSRSTSRTTKRAAATVSITRTPTTVDNDGIGRRTTVTNPVASNAVMDDPASGDSIAGRTRSRITSIAATITDPTTPIATTAAVGNDKRPAQYSSLGDTIFDVGQEFNSVSDFRVALRMYAIVKGFASKTIKSGKARVTAQCSAEGCPWRVHASRLPTMQRFKIRKINNVHTCGGGVGKDGHPNATSLWVASIIKDKLHDKPQYTPKEIVNDIYREYGVNVSFKKARAGKEVAEEQLQDSQSYSQLPWFCNRLKETNPGSLITLTTTDKSRFHRLFVSFHASRHGFENGCRPLILLDRTSLRKECRGMLLAAVSVDGDDAIFPVAFAIVDFESYDNWIWFLTELKSAVSTNRTITFVSDWLNGLEEAVPQVFEGSYHAYSLHHLIEGFKLVLKGPSEPVKDALADEIQRAAYSCSITDFNACIGKTRNFSHNVALWILESKPEHWSNAFFEGLRYDHLSSNIAELFYGWISEERRLSIIQMIDMIRCKMMEMIYTRREASSTWSTILTPSMEQRLEREKCNSHSLSVLFSSGSIFEVRDDSVNIVDIETWDCTCRRWKMTGLPCVHAAAVFDRTGRNSYDYCSRYFTVDCYRSAYSESIHPIPDIGNPVSEDSNTELIVRPPRSHPPHRSPGRPKSKQTELLDPSKRLKLLQHCQHCSRCGGCGHNKRRCRGVL